MWTHFFPPSMIFILLFTLKDGKSVCVMAPNMPFYNTFHFQCQKWQHLKLIDALRKNLPRWRTHTSPLYATRQCSLFFLCPGSWITAINSFKTSTFFTFPTMAFHTMTIKITDVIFKQRVRGRQIQMNIFLESLIFSMKISPI